MAEDPLLQLNRMLTNFEIVSRGEHLNYHQCRTQVLQAKTYTNFSVHEILKPSFGRLTLNCDNDSDSAYTSDSCDHYSSCDETHDYSSECSRCTTPEKEAAVHRDAIYGSTASVVHSTRRNGVTKSDLPTRSWTDRVKRKLDDDGYSSSDSDSVLDLRIQRKKTPPQITGELPAWVYCTRYSDRPSAGPRSRRRRTGQHQPRRARTAFNDDQLNGLNIEFDRDQYLSESRRHQLAAKLNLNEASVKIWFQNRRAQAKKSAVPQQLAVELHAQGLYNHKVAPGAGQS